MKLPKLNLICGENPLRPTLNYILVTKEKTFATDAHAIVIHDSVKLFGEQFVNDMPERYLIHGKHWAKMAKGFYKLYFRDNMIEVFNDGIIDLYPIQFEENININFPDCMEAKNKHKKENIEFIGLDAYLLYKLQQAMFLPYEIKSVVLIFSNETRAVIVKQNYESDVECEGLIMPVVIRGTS